MIKPGGPNNDQEALLLDHRNIKNKPGGFALVGWVIDPRLFKCYSWNPSAETFKNFLSRNYKPHNNEAYNYLKRTPSQEGISSPEQIEDPYLASILDFTYRHVDFLKDIKKASLLHLQETYDVNLNTDQVELFFHFPYGEDTTTVHLHIRVNQGRHPLEMTRSISLDTLISLLEKKVNIADFLARNNPYFMENSQVVLNALDNIEGVHIQLIKNPLFLASPMINSAQIFKNMEFLNLIPEIYSNKGRFIMKIKLEDFDKKIAENKLTIKDIIDKTLAINIALKNYFPDTPDFRNPVIQGHAAWIIMYEYLSQNREKLSVEIQDFLQNDDPEKVNIFCQLDKTSKALEQNPKAPIRADINKLNEVEIMTRSPNGQVYHYFNETEKKRILSLMEQKNLLHSKNLLKATFYLLYRPRDGRFFCVPDTEIDLCADLNLSPIQYADLSSTHININEGLNCQDIFEKHFKEQSTDKLPCKVKSKDSLLYCGMTFNNVEIDLEQMYLLEISKNAAICEANILRLKGPINDFKKEYNFPELEHPVPLHINIGVILRKEAQEIFNTQAKTILDLIEGSIFANSLKKALSTAMPSLGNSELSMFKPVVPPATHSQSLQTGGSTFQPLFNM